MRDSSFSVYLLFSSLKLTTVRQQLKRSAGQELNVEFFLKRNALKCIQYSFLTGTIAIENWRSWLAVILPKLIADQCENLPSLSFLATTSENRTRQEDLSNGTGMTQMESKIDFAIIY